MKFKALFFLSILSVAVLSYLFFKKGTPGENSIVESVPRGNSNSESFAFQTSKNPTPATSRAPASTSYEDLLAAHVSPFILRSFEVRVMDENEKILRLGLYKEDLWISGSDFVFEKSDSGALMYVDGAWQIEESEFPAKHPGLSENEVLNLVASELPSSGLKDLELSQVSEYWRLRSKYARQIAVWRIEYRINDGGLIKENLMIDLTSQKLMKKYSALIE